ncbi:hypothetical protein X943_002619 [Babesia divergens]|uniref:Uncharacterized protein n=1 Tax=Babesia divergens TaxID=32595 RepID=A0AAD9GLT0_BABDI|nr:hypothetical protein X943_002619 [Babesia divergens]
MPSDDNTLSCWDTYTDSEDEATTNAHVDLNSLPENLRSLRLSQAADNEFVDDLFSVTDKNSTGNRDHGDNDVFASSRVKTIIPADPLAHVTLKCLKDCDMVAKKLSQKIEQSQAKSAVWLQFLDTLFQSCEKKIELKDLQTLKRKVETAIKNREAKQREVAFSKKKPNDITSSKNYQDELDMLYGDLSDDDEPFYYT